MKTLLFIVSLSLASIVICACTFLGVRMGPALWRGLVVFILSYIVGLMGAVVFFVSYLSPKKPAVTTFPNPDSDENDADASTQSDEEKPAQ